MRLEIVAKKWEDVTSAELAVGMLGIATNGWKRLLMDADG